MGSIKDTKTKKRKVEIESLNNISLGDEYLPIKIKQMSNIYKLNRNRISPFSYSQTSIMSQNQNTVNFYQNQIQILTETITIKDNI